MSDTSEDHYSVLGVLPEAEPVVVTAAYRALAQRYHPDRWGGSAEEAHARMARINTAYAILSDPSKRSEYDRSRNKQSHRGFADAQESSKAFEDAMSQLQDRWAIACELFPDLPSYRQSLARISYSLAFTYTSLLLEKRSFAQRQDIAKSLEQAFLERYFSSDPKLIAYAKGLIEAGHRDALRELNRFVDVVGSGVEPDRIIQLVNSKFSLGPLWEQESADKNKKSRREALVQRLGRSHDFHVARELAQHDGYEIGELGNGLFQPTSVVVTDITGRVTTHPNKATFVFWVKSELCRQS